jgi:hypothetical protein
MHVHLLLRSAPGQGRVNRVGRVWRGAGRRARRGAVDERPAPLPLVAITSLADGLAHLVAEHILCAVDDAEPPLVACCGHRVLVTSLVTRPGPPCPQCGALAGA